MNSVSHSLEIEVQVYGGVSVPKRDKERQDVQRKVVADERYKNVIGGVERAPFVGNFGKYTKRRDVYSYLCANRPEN